MAQIEFLKAFSRRNNVTAPRSVHRPKASETRQDLQDETGGTICSLRPFRTSDRWIMLFAGLAFAGGLFGAFNFFNGVEHVHAAANATREIVYARPVVGDEPRVVTPPLTIAHEAAFQRGQISQSEPQATRQTGSRATLPFASAEATSTTPVDSILNQSALTHYAHLLGVPSTVVRQSGSGASTRAGSTTAQSASEVLPPPAASVTNPTGPGKTSARKAVAAVNTRAAGFGVSPHGSQSTHARAQQTGRNAGPTNSVAGARSAIGVCAMNAPSMFRAKAGIQSGAGRVAGGSSLFQSQSTGAIRGMGKALAGHGTGGGARHGGRVGGGKR